MWNPDRQRFFDNIVQVVEQKLAKDKSKAGKAAIPSGYTTGNPTVQEPEETASTVGTRTAKLVQPYGPGAMAPAASDAMVRLRDSEGNPIVLGKLVDLSSVIFEASSWNGLKWVQPGATVLLSANTERNTTSASYVDLKKFLVTRPGKYRVNFGLAATGATGASARAVISTDGGDIVASSDATSTGTYPTFNSQSVDMTVPVLPGQLVKVQVKNTAGTTSYINNCVLSYADATSAQGNQDTVVTD